MADSKDMNLDNLLDKLEDDITNKENFTAEMMRKKARKIINLITEKEEEKKKDEIFVYKWAKKLKKTTKNKQKICLMLFKNLLGRPGNINNNNKTTTTNNVTIAETEDETKMSIKKKAREARMSIKATLKASNIAMFKRIARIPLFQPGLDNLNSNIYNSSKGVTIRVNNKQVILHNYSMLRMFHFLDMEDNYIVRYGPVTNSIFNLQPIKMDEKFGKLIEKEKFDYEKEQLIKFEEVKHIEIPVSNYVKKLKREATSIEMSKEKFDITSIKFDNFGVFDEMELARPKKMRIVFTKKE